MKIRTLILALAFSMVALAAFGQGKAKEGDALAVVKSKTGMEYIFVAPQLLMIKNYRNTWEITTQGITRTIGEECNLSILPVEVDMGDFKKVIVPGEVKSIQFDEVKTGSFKITLTMKDGARLKLDLLERWQETNDDDGIKGTEKDQGDIKIPFNRIESIVFIRPLVAFSTYHAQSGIQPPTKAKLLARVPK